MVEDYVTEEQRLHRARIHASATVYMGPDGLDLQVSKDWYLSLTEDDRRIVNEFIVERRREKLDARYQKRRAEIAETRKMFEGVAVGK